MPAQSAVQVGTKLYHHYSSVIVPQHSATYNFSGPSAHPPHTLIHLDPRFLPPLPPSDDHDLYEPAAIAKSRGLQAAPKVAGSRRKSKKEKGKKRQLSSDSEDDSDAPQRPAKRGRPQGSRNFEPEDTSALLDIVQKELPLGPKGWAAIHKRFRKWAHKNSRPDRAGKSLETKYKQVRPSSHMHCHI